MNAQATLLLPPFHEVARFRSLLDASETQAWDAVSEACADKPGFDPRLRRELASTWLGRRQISLRDWLVAVRCFDLELGGRETAAVSGLSLPTVYRVYRDIRLALASRDPRWQDAVRAMDEDEAGGPELLGVFRDGDDVRVVPVEKPRKGKLPQAPCAVYDGGFVYTAPHLGFDALCWHASVTGAGYRALDRRGGRDLFLKYLASRVPKHYGIPLERFPLFIKEYETRFNTRHRSLFEVVIQALTDEAPNS